MSHNGMASVKYTNHWSLEGMYSLRLEFGLSI